MQRKEFLSGSLLGVAGTALAACSSSGAIPGALASNKSNNYKVVQTAAGVQVIDQRTGQWVFSFAPNEDKTAFIYKTPTAILETLSIATLKGLKVGDSLALGNRGRMTVIDDRTIAAPDGTEFTIEEMGTANARLVRYGANRSILNQAPLPSTKPRGGTIPNISAGCGWAIFDEGLAIAGTVLASESGVGFVVGVACIFSAQAHVVMECY